VRNRSRGELLPGLNLSNSGWDVRLVRNLRGDLRLPEHLGRKAPHRRSISSRAVSATSDFRVTLRTIAAPASLAEPRELGEGPDSDKGAKEATPATAPPLAILSTLPASGPWRCPGTLSAPSASWPVGISTTPADRSNGESGAHRGAPRARGPRPRSRAPPPAIHGPPWAVLLLSFGSDRPGSLFGASPLHPRSPQGDLRANSSDDPTLRHVMLLRLWGWRCLRESALTGCTRLEAPTTGCSRAA